MSVETNIQRIAWLLAQGLCANRFLREKGPSWGYDTGFQVIEHRLPGRIVLGCDFHPEFTGSKSWQHVRATIKPCLIKGFTLELTGMRNNQSSKKAIQDTLREWLSRETYEFLKTKKENV